MAEPGPDMWLVRHSDNSSVQPCSGTSTVDGTINNKTSSETATTSPPLGSDGGQARINDSAVTTAASTNVHTLEKRSHVHTGQPNDNDCELFAGKRMCTDQNQLALRAEGGSITDTETPVAAQVQLAPRAEREPIIDLCTVSDQSTPVCSLSFPSAAAPSALSALFQKGSHGGKHDR